VSEAYQHEGVESQEEVDSPAQDGGSHSFKERLHLVRATFSGHQTIIDNPAEVIQRKSCLGVGSDDETHTRTVASLPWHPLRSKLVSDDMAKLLGKAPSKGRKPATFGPGRYLSRPSQRRSAYRITGDPPLSAAPVPPDFHLLQPKGSATEHVAVRLSAAEAEDMETGLRQSTAVASHQDWFLGGAREILEAIKPDDDPAKTKTQLDQAVSLLKSGAHAGMDLQTSQHTSLHNLLLRRRDAFLNTTVKEFTPVARRALRQHSLDSPTLFDNSACTQASKQILKAGTLSKVTSGSGSHRPPPAAAASKAKAAPKAKPWSAPKPQPYQPQPQKSSPPKRGKTSPRSSFKGGRGGGGNNGRK
jgi:hypothetical protein